MENEQFNSEIDRRHRGRARKGRVLAGFFLVMIGILLLLRQLDYYMPEWLFTWPMILIALGVFSALKDGFRGPGWFIFIAIGSVFLLDHIYPGFNMNRYIWPMVFILIGIMFLFRPRGCRGHRWKRRMERWDQRSWRNDERTGATQTGVHSAVDPNVAPDPEDFLDVTSVFGGVKKIVVSKNFKGADITCFMGGAEINLSQADIKGTARIDATNIFGGTKLIVPSTWEVKSEASAVFGGVDDKRELHSIKPDPNKVLILDGSCIFGGIEIRSY